MTILQQIERIRYMHHLISSNSTGVPDEFAGKLNLSRRQLYHLLEELKDLGLEIAYSRMQQTFYYINTVELKIEIKMQQLDDGKCKDIFGGANLTFFNNNIYFRAIKVHGRVATLSL